MSNFMQSLLMWKETTTNSIPTSPACYLAKVTAYALKTSQSSETVNELGNGRGASAKSYGVSSHEGNLDFVWNTDNAPILFTHGIGAATSTANATATDWAATTAYAKGDLENHSDGLHTLVCYTAGTSGATEPDLSAYTTAAAGRGVQVTDGSVVWIVMPLLVEQSGVRADCLPTFGCEVQDDDSCAASSPQYVRYTGGHFGSLPFQFQGSSTSIRSSISTMAMAVEDSLVVADAGGSYEAMSDKAGFTQAELISDYFFMEDFVLTINGSASSLSTTNINFTVNNTVSMEDTIEGTKINNVGIVTLEGTIDILLDTQMYLDAISHVNTSLKLTATKDNGCVMEIELPQFKMERAYKMFQTEKTTALSIPFSAFDSTAAYSAQWRTISPTSY